MNRQEPITANIIYYLSLFLMKKPVLKALVSMCNLIQVNKLKYLSACLSSYSVLIFLKDVSRNTGNILAL